MRDGGGKAYDSSYSDHWQGRICSGGGEMGGNCRQRQRPGNRYLRKTLTRHVGGGRPITEKDDASAWAGGASRFSDNLSLGPRQPWLRSGRTRCVAARAMMGGEFDVALFPHLLLRALGDGADDCAWLGRIRSARAGRVSEAVASPAGVRLSAGELQLRAGAGTGLLRPVRLRFGLWTGMRRVQ
jgi:hypothetical protein